MAYFFGILFFIFAILFSVALHELGHLIPAKIFDVKVPQYFIGFGPTIWSKKIGETEYGIKLIPLGGYVRLASMLYYGSENRRQYKKDGVTLTLAEEARRASAGELEPGEEHRAFWRLAVWKRFIVMFGGPFMNLVLAFACIGGVFVALGTPEATPIIEKVQMCVDSENETQCTKGQTPAALANLQAGDTIVQWNDKDIASWNDVTQAIMATGNNTADVKVKRGEKYVDLQVTPMERIVDVDGQKQTRYFVGITSHIEQKKKSFNEVPAYLWGMTTQTVSVIAHLPVELWNVTKVLLTGEGERNGVMGLVGVADMAGDITSAESAQYTNSQRFGDLIFLLGSLNFSLFAFNLIPLLPLDGGHILGALIEGVQSMWARLRKKPKPDPFDTARFTGLSHAVALVFIAMTVLLIVADIFVPVM
ncbi:MAG: site-2 protease family protein [Actinomycetaceae bacterium]|nr:site-2 protease family protein [Actinomycetaceae bacterium]